MCGSRFRYPVPAFLVAFSVVGQLTNAEVRPEGPTVTISALPFPGSQVRPTGAYDPATKKFFICWAQNKSDPDLITAGEEVRGRMIALDGRRTNPKRYSFVGPRPEADAAGVVYSHQDNRWLLVWQDSGGGEDGRYGIYSAVIGADGKALKHEFVTYYNWPYVPIVIAYHPSTSGSLIGYLSGNDGWALQSLDRDGAKNGAPRLVTGPDTDWGVGSLSILAVPSVLRYFLFWERDHKHVMFQKVTLEGKKVGPTKKLYTNPPPGNPAVVPVAAYNPAKNEFLVMLNGSYRGGWRRKLQTFRVDLKGDRLNDPMTVGIGNDERAGIVYDPVTEGYLIAYLREKELWARQLNSLGEPVREEVLVHKAAHRIVGDLQLIYGPEGTAFVCWTRFQYSAIIGRFLKTTKD